MQDIIERITGEKAVVTTARSKVSLAIGMGTEMI